jgi:hypothetical protein
MLWLLRASLLALLVPALGLAEVRLANLSTRASVGSGTGTLVTGFVIAGTAPKDVLVRAIGPSLSAFGITDGLQHPRMQLRDGTGATLALADQWPGSLAPTFAQLGAWPLPAGSNDSALRVTLPPGGYNVEITGADGGRGTALLEVYEVDGASRLVNLSARGLVQTGDRPLISGMVLAGFGTKRVLIRASGPALLGYGIPDALTNPVLQVFDGTGQIIARSTGWDEGGLTSEIRDASERAGAPAFPDGSKDAATALELASGAYSMHVRGANDAQGVTLLEVFDVTPPADHPVYGDAWFDWSLPAVSARLGPTFDQLSPGAVDDRPMLFRPDSKAVPAGYYVRINPYELGDVPGPDTNYWSDSGQVAYIPDDPANDPGLDRIQTFAYYNQVFAISPRLDWASGRPHPDPQTRESAYAKLNGAPPRQPIAMVRNQAMQQNEALVLYRDGLFAVAGTQTSRAGSERPYPGFKFPANKVPRALAITTSNEFAVVAVWDTDRQQGQVAVVALEAKYLPFHTWPYMGMPNQGSWSAFKLLGYVDVPMRQPDAIAAASNGLWTGPSSTQNKVLSQIDLTDDAQRALIATGAWQNVVAKNGYVIVASSTEDKVAILDLTPLFGYMRDSYLQSTDALAATVGARGAPPDAFPQTFAVRPAIAPKVVWQASMPAPTAVLAGHKVDRWSVDRYKAYVATRDGTLHIIDASPLMVRNSWEVRGKLQEIGTVAVGRNPVALIFARYGETGLPLIPNDNSGKPRAPDPLNNLVYVACRGDREVDGVVTWAGTGQVFRRIRDARLSDPVGLGIASRANILTVADFLGRKLVSFRIGTINDTRNNRVYPVGGDGSVPYEYAGELALPGYPFLVNSTNVN